MANGERCKHCGWQETDHNLQINGACKRFRSEVRHKPSCPVLGCDGNCDETIKLAEEPPVRRRDEIFVIVGDRVIDIGS